MYNSCEEFGRWHKEHVDMPENYSICIKDARKLWHESKYAHSTK